MTQQCWCLRADCVVGLVSFLRSFWFSDADGSVMARKAALGEEDFLFFFSSF